MNCLLYRCLFSFEMNAEQRRNKQQQRNQQQQQQQQQTSKANHDVAKNGDNGKKNVSSIEEVANDEDDGLIKETLLNETNDNVEDTSKGLNGGGGTNGNGVNGNGVNGNGGEDTCIAVVETVTSVAEEAN